MNDFLLKVVATIIGVGAASGIFYRDDSVYLISDDSNYLYHYSLSADSLSKTLLVADSIHERLPKKQKRDFEAMAVDQNRVYVYGSGSSDNGKRNLRITLGINNQQPDTAEDLTHLYSRLREQSGLVEEDFNVEGAIHRDGQTYLFNRGNGPSHMNGVFKLDAAARDTVFIPVELPKLKGVQAAFTDAIALDDMVYFLAAAEDAGSIYHDGAVCGTLIGRLSLPDLTLQDYTVISPTHKFEGITFVKQGTDSLTFFLCEDPDNGTVESTLYQLTVSR
ncbi:DUF6929 family protein [Parapedobacter koreensis]|uniref:Uncharacterized protein n=1 Tax=Parapedobacter koreensis TaxID=332977 RepID=A0A1H7LR87_9SPHI|nr:hypothetical protein [Parapedobacter koreensis]SEL01399.1 hypothetical protein SAMN05421740_103242 [Parapedobacter koreensis]